MAWWGKLVGGAIGFSLGGPIGGIVGAVLGHGLDEASETPTEDSDGPEELEYDAASETRAQAERDAAADQETVQGIFACAAFSVLGAVAKADGRVTREEVDFARGVMDEWDLTEEQREFAVALFRAGKEPGFDLGGVLDQLRDATRSARELRRVFLELIASAAFADGTLHTREQSILEQIAERLELSHFELLTSIATARAQSARADDAHEEEGGHTASSDELDRAYTVLGLSPGASHDDVRAAYRKLMHQYHPDRLVSKGLPEELMQFATHKAQEITAAYEMIRSRSGA